MIASGGHGISPSTTTRSSRARSRLRGLLSAALLVTSLAWVASGPVPTATAANVINVPADQPTLQAAVQAASTGDTIVLAPGTYQGGVWIQDKHLTIASRYLTTGDPSYITQTIVNGYGANYCAGASGCAGNVVLEFGSNAGGSLVTGLTVSGGIDGVRGNSRVDISHSRLVNNEDGADFGNESSGTWTDTVFANNTDDGIDLNGRVQISLSNSTIQANAGDGIEFRLYPYSGPTLDVNIIGNRFVRNDSDGIQLIDSDDVSSRVIRIERNVFDHNGAAAIGCLPDQQTNEDFSGAPLAERVYVEDNTFNGDRYGISGGANSMVLNNIFTGIPVRALHRVGGSSIAAYNLFWNNGTNYAESVVDAQTSVFADPLLAADMTLQPGSPAIDAGTASFQWNGETVLNLAADSYTGAAPDLGAYEYSAGGTPTNRAPVVDAGPDQTITLPAGATLDATATDDGQPSNTLTTGWTQDSGPGTTTFANPGAVDTTATFSVAGTYVLRLTASDGERSAFDTVQITVRPAPAPGSGTVDRRVSAGSDDVEESATGSYSGSSSDLELVYDASTQQVGLRFTNMTIPPGSTITSAYVQFETDETSSQAVTLTVQGQAADNPATFSSANKVSTRPRTATSVSWSPASWTVVGEAGANQRTSDLAPVVQEIVNRPGWSSGNALALVVTGPAGVTAHRTARAYEGVPTGAPLLHVEYAAGGTSTNRAPVVSAGPDQTITLPADATLDGTVSDDGLPSRTLTTTWSQDSGPGTTTFANPNAVDTTAGFSVAGTYVLRLTATDGVLTTSDTVQVTVRPEPTPGSGTTIMGVGDIASSGSTLVNAAATGDLIRAASPDAAFTLGDNAYNSGTLEEYQTAYDSTWGSFKAITHPVPGNHDYEPPPPDGYVTYFGAANVTNPVDGGLYYAWDVGNGWRAYAVNTEVSTSGAQLTWLQNDVAAHPGMHYILYTHHPRYSSGSPSSYAVDAVCPLWNVLASTGGLEIVMAGHMHNYERFTRMDCAGNATAAGARSFVAGSGGNQLYPFGTPQPGSEARNGTDYGVLRLVLHDSSYEWSFIASGRGWNGSTSVDTLNAGLVLDSGTQATHDTSVPTNAVPSVNAGTDQTITLPAAANLDGTVTDDGLPNPPGTLTTTWSKVSGPGTVTFGNATAVDTTASFSEAGSYVLQLTASDSAASASDTVAVTVQQASGGGSQSVDVRISAGANDVEQAVSGSVSLTSSDLELTTDGTTQQVVGTRFPGLQVPRGATITRAYVQFQVDEVSTDASSMTIRAENSDNAAVYTSTSGSVTARATTGGVAWSAPTWPTANVAGADQRTPDISSLVQAVVSRTGWTSGNALALQFSGTGRRTAEAYEGSATGAPLLHVEYTTGGGGTPTNIAPTVNAGPDQTVTLPTPAALDGTVSDDGLPNPPATVTTTWSKVSGPGTVTFGNAGNVDTSATFSDPGSYVLQLSATDSDATASDTLTVSVLAGGGAQTVEVRISAGSDDVEESATGSYSGSSSDLELVNDGSNQLVGLRFPGLAIPKGATVTRAYVQFTTDEVQSEATSLTIRGQAADNPVTFSSATKPSTRTRTTASSAWNPAPWTTVGQAGADQRTTDLSGVLQEIVGRQGWASGNALVLIVTGTGHRTARAYEGVAAAAPLLHVEYTTP